MSSEYYFKKWKKTLADLEALVNLDVHFQETKAHDKKRCEATRRLSGVLSRYIVVYNEAWECCTQNLQVQKTTYMHDVLKVVVSRIRELKQELQILEVSETHFGSNGIIDYNLTPDDTLLAEIPDVNERPEAIRNVLQDIFEQVKERKKLLEKEREKAVEEAEEEINRWDADNVQKNEEVFQWQEKKVQLTDEQLESKRMAELIQAQERTRLIIAEITQKRNRRAKWEKELSGTLPEPARYEIRERAAELIQLVSRAFFEMKRQKVLQCKRNELLGINSCLAPKSGQKEKLEQIKSHRAQLKSKYEEQWKTEYEGQKQEYLNRRSDEIGEDYRDYIRDWFKTWYESITFFHDIPPEKQGGVALIIKEELPTPEEWLETYKAYLADKKSNRGKTALDKKLAKQEAKREAMELKRAENMKKKIEEALRRKCMKNPSLHPGFHFPVSKYTEHILEAIGNYFKDWAELDAMETKDVKEKHVRSVDLSNVYMEAKMEIASTVQEDMRNELKLLKRALKTDYENKGEKMPEPMKQRYNREKKKKQVQKTLSVNIAEKLEDLVFRGYLKEYPKTTIDEFIGDPNFAGDDLRCDYITALPHNGEMRSLWWDKCRELHLGFRKILLVGPRGSGKTTLVHVIATLNDAVLFELDPRSVQGLLENGTYLDYLVRSVASCARVVQPSVIHVKHVHRMFYRKVPKQDADVDWKLIQRYFIKKLFKYINKTDKVTVIGSCVDPWVAKSKQLVKMFPTVVLMPDSSHGTVAQIIKHWVLSHTVIPADFDVTCLAHVLKGYSFGYLQNVLERFMSAETIARIAARGLSPMEVYDFILADKTEEKVDYEMYMKWYYEKTVLGKKEHKHAEEQLQVKRALEEHALRLEKHKKSRANTPAPSHTALQGKLKTIQEGE